MSPSSLVTSKLVNPAAPCAWQVVMSTRRWLAESCLGGTVVTFRGRLFVGRHPAGPLGGKDRTDRRLQDLETSESDGLACGVVGGLARTSSALRWRLLYGSLAAGMVEVGRTGWRVNRNTLLNSSHRRQGS
jgi:hypothetical protein